ncbi:MAG: hypothetical protein ACE5KE_15820 [Methanosarcinales archaeon]
MTTNNTVSIDQLEMFQRLTRSEYAWIVNLVSKQLADGAKIEKIINQITIDRIKMAKEKFEFSKKILDALESTEINQKIIVTLNYYAMYQVARAVVFHTHRSDVDNHEKLSYKLGIIFGKEYEELLTHWRELRNEFDYSPYPKIDMPLNEIVEQSIIDTEKLITESVEYIKNRGVKL